MCGYLVSSKVWEKLICLQSSEAIHTRKTVSFCILTQTALDVCISSLSIQYAKKSKNTSRLCTCPKHFSLTFNKTVYLVNSHHHVSSLSSYTIVHFQRSVCSTLRSRPSVIYRTHTAVDQPDYSASWQALNTLKRDYVAFERRNNTALHVKCWTAAGILGLVWPAAVPDLLYD